MLIKLKNPKIPRFDGLNGKDEWCIDTSNILELYTEKGRYYVLFYTYLIHDMHSSSEVVCAEITAEEYEYIFTAIGFKERNEIALSQQLIDKWLK